MVSKDMIVLYNDFFSTRRRSDMYLFLVIFDTSKSIHVPGGDVLREGDGGRGGRDGLQQAGQTLLCTTSIVF